MDLQFISPAVMEVWWSASCDSHVITSYNSHMTSSQVCHVTTIWVTSSMEVCLNNNTGMTKWTESSAELALLPGSCS